MLNTGS